jgi:hypothetical protein
LIWIVPVAIVALAAVVLGVIFIPHLTAPQVQTSATPTPTPTPTPPPTVQGTWAGSVTYTVSDTSNSSTQSLQYGLYLDLAQNGSQVSGSGEICGRSGGSIQTQDFTVTGSQGSGSSYSMTWTANNSPLNVQAAVSGSSMTVNYQATQGTATATLSGSIHSGSQSDFQNICNTLPMPTPTPTPA